MTQVHSLSSHPQDILVSSGFYVAHTADIGMQAVRADVLHLLGVAELDGKLDSA